MTWAEFEASYRLLQEITTLGGATTHHALSAEGVVVMVHIVRPGGPTDLLDRAQATGRERVIERVRVDDADVLVTRFIMEFESLEAWVAGQERSAGPDSPPAPTATPPADLPAPTSDPAPADAPGEFTRLFRAPSSGPAGERGEEPPATEGPAAGGRAPGADDQQAADTEPEPGAREPGEFTRAFRAPRSSSTPAESPTPSGSATPGEPSKPAEPSAPIGPGTPDQPAAAEPARPPKPTAPSASEPGEFTRMFRAPEASPAAGADQEERAPTRPSPAADPPRPAPEPPPATPSAPPEPRWSFDAADRPAGGADIQDGYADRLRTSGPTSPAPDPPTPPAPEPDTGPGAYTRMISTQRPPPTAPADPAPPADGPARSGGTSDPSGGPGAAGAPTATDQAGAPDNGPRDTTEQPSIVPFVVAIVLIVVTAVALVLGVALFA
jgi:hypothetical protein